MITEEQLKNWYEAIEAYWDKFEFYCATHPIPIIPPASGVQLDALGALFGINRKSNENDDELRKRISDSFDSLVVTT